MPQQTPQQLANALNPTPFNVNVPGNGVYSSGDAGQILIKVGNTLYQTGLDDLGRRYANTLGYAQGQRANESGAAATTYGTQYLQSLGLDPGGLQKLGGAQVADLLGNAGKLGLTFSNNLDLTNLPSLLKTQNTPGTTTALNTQSNQLASPTQLAKASAAQNQQLAGYQGMNVVQSTTPEGIAGVTKTPLAGTTTASPTLDSLKQQLIGAQNSLTQMGAPPQIPSSISSSSFSSAPAYNFQSPQQTPTYPVVSLGTPANPNVSADGQISMTQSEQQGQTLTQQLEALNQQLVGESAYRTSQENQAGLPALVQTQRDLTSRLTTLKNEALAIPLQLQQDSTGRGITTGGLAPIQASALRENAIQSLTTSALLEATNGNITTAQTLVDRAVAQQFDPIKEQINATTNNLKLILNSPKASVEDKNRAQAQLDIQNAKQDALTQAKKMQSDILTIATNAASNGAPATVLQQISNAKTPFEALQVAGQYADKASSALPTASIQEYQFAVQNGYTGTFSQYQNEDANRKAKVAAATAGLTNSDRTAFNSIVARYNASPLIAAANRTPVLESSINEVKKSPSNGALQLNLAYSYIQALDTYQSAVREGELSLVNSIDSKIGALSNSISQIQNGQIVRPEVALQIADAASNILSTIKSAAANQSNVYKSQANAVGLGDTWNKFISGFTPSYSTGSGGSTGSASTSGTLTDADRAQLGY